jgi:rubrerythrin
MVPSISEDCLIFYGLSPEITKFRQVYSAISDFLNDKKTIDPSGRFNLIVFLQNAPNFLDNFTFDINLILETLKSSNKNIVRANTFVGILIGVHLIIQNFKSVSEKLLRLLILLDGGSTKIPFDRLDSIISLINDAKNLPFYIDIIAIDVNDKQEIDHLKRIANLGDGEFYEINDLKDLKPLANILSKKKFVKESLFSRYKLKMAQKENQPFYFDLAEEPEAFYELIACSICFQKDVEGIVMCPSCRTVAHKICWALWAKNSNPQILHVFRCHNCFKLLKLDREFVFDVQIGKIPPKNEFAKVKRKNNLDYLRELESKNQPKLIQAEDPMVTDVRTIIESKKKISQTEEKEIVASFDFCPICNNIIREDEKNCPTCGFDQS